MSDEKKLLQSHKSPAGFSNKRDPKTLLREILNFGPTDTTSGNREITERIKQLVREMEEINRRIDELTHRM